MVNDDFSALDFLSAGGFHLTSVTEHQRPAKKKKRFGLRTKPKAPAKRRLSELLPLLGRKLVKPMAPKTGGQSKLNGWGVALSWPRAEVRDLPNWDDAVDRLHS